jgi:hypothetical protein
MIPDLEGWTSVHSVDFMWHDHLVRYTVSKGLWCATKPVADTRRKTSWWLWRLWHCSKLMYQWQDRWASTKKIIVVYCFFETLRFFGWHWKSWEWNVFNKNSRHKRNPGISSQLKTTRIWQRFPWAPVSDAGVLIAKNEIKWNQIVKWMCQQNRCFVMTNLHIHDARSVSSGSGG